MFPVHALPRGCGAYLTALEGSFGAMPAGYCALRELHFGHLGKPLMVSPVIDWVVARMQRSGIRGHRPGFHCIPSGLRWLELPASD